MKFSVFYEMQLPAPHREGEETRMFAEALEHVEPADRLGFHCMWGVEHHFLDDHALSSAPELWPAVAAARSTNIRIGHGITCMPPAFSHPAHIAERIATLNQVSGGRAEFGTGESSSRMPKEIPSVPAYGHFSHMPTAEDIALETSTDTTDALGLGPSYATTTTNTTAIPDRKDLHGVQRLGRVLHPSVTANLRRGQ